MLPRPATDSPQGSTPELAPDPTGRRRRRKLPFARPDITEAEKAAVARVMDSGWLTSGPETQAFEQEFAIAVGARHAIALSSATAALHLSMARWGIAEGDGVLIPAITFTATAEVVTYSGASPIFVDVEAQDLMVSAAGLRRFAREKCREQDGLLIHKATGTRIRGIIAVHIGGNPCDLDGIHDFAKQYSLRVAEDAAHAFPAAHRGRPIGSISEHTAFSFYATKNLTTGEGGMLTTNNDEDAAFFRRARLHGIEGQTYGRKRWFYDVVEPGYKYNMTDMAAAIGRVQLQRSPEMLARRTAIAEVYRRELADLSALVLPPRSEHAQSDHLFVIQMSPDAPITRDRFVEELYARGIGVSLHFIPLYRHSYYRKLYPLQLDDFPGSELAYERMLSLPIYSSMSRADAADVVYAIRESLQA